MLIAYYGAAVSQQSVTRELVRPSQADPSVRNFDDPKVVLLPPTMTASQPPLALFLPGSKGKFESAERLMQVGVG